MHPGWHGPAEALCSQEVSTALVRDQQNTHAMRAQAIRNIDLHLGSRQHRLLWTRVGMYSAVAKGLLVELLRSVAAQHRDIFRVEDEQPHRVQACPSDDPGALPAGGLFARYGLAANDLHVEHLGSEDALAEMLGVHQGDLLSMETSLRAIPLAGV